MKYLLLVYSDEKKWLALSDDARARVFEECAVYGAELTQSGHFLGGAPLEPTATARTIRRSNGKSVITDGPFAETREVLAGYHLVECKDIQEATALGERFPGLKHGLAIEVRPVLVD